MHEEKTILSNQKEENLVNHDNSLCLKNEELINVKKKYNDMTKEQETMIAKILD
jgi:hypothetical protein